MGWSANTAIRWDEKVSYGEEFKTRKFLDKPRFQTYSRYVRLHMSKLFSRFFVFQPIKMLIIQIVSSNSLRGYTGHLFHIWNENELGNQ